MSLTEKVPAKRIAEIEEAIMDGAVIIHADTHAFYDNIPLYHEEWRWYDALKTYYRAVTQFVPSYFSVQEFGAGGDERFGARVCRKAPNSNEIERAESQLAEAIAIHACLTKSQIIEYIDLALINVSLRDYEIGYQERFVPITKQEYRALMDSRKGEPCDFRTPEGDAE